MASINWTASGPSQVLYRKTYINPVGASASAGVSSHNDSPPILHGSAVAKSVSAGGQAAKASGAAIATIRYKFTVVPDDLNDTGPWTGVGDFHFSGPVELEGKVPGADGSDTLVGAADAEVKATLEIYKVGQSGPQLIFGPETISDSYQLFVTNRTTSVILNRQAFDIKAVTCLLSNQVENFYADISVHISQETYILGSGQGQSTVAGKVNLDQAGTNADIRLILNAV